VSKKFTDTICDTEHHVTAARRFCTLSVGSQPRHLPSARPVCDPLVIVEKILHQQCLDTV